MNWRELSCDKNTKGTNTGDGEVCDQCLREQYKQRLIDEHLYTKKLLENTIRKLCEYCRSDRVEIDGDIELCGNCGTVDL